MPGASRKTALWAAVACAAALAAAGFWRLASSRLGRAAPALPSAADLDAAIAQDQAALSRNPDDLKALTDLGLRYYLKGPSSYTEAVNDLERAREMGALDARIFYCLGVMYQSLGLYPFAIVNYQRYLRNEPQDEKAALLEAKLLYQAGHFQDAAERYRRLEPQDPENPVLLEDLALSLWKTNQTQAAMDALGRMAALGPVAAARAAYDAARIDYGLKRYSDAADELAKAQDAAGQGAGQISEEDFYRLLAQASQKLGRLDAALSAWNKVMALDPKDAAARREVKILSRRLSRRRKARPGRKALSKR